MEDFSCVCCGGKSPTPPIEVTEVHRCAIPIPPNCESSHCRLELWQSCEQGWVNSDAQQVGKFPLSERFLCQELNVINAN
jgi:hypothetical protein